MTTTTKIGDQVLIGGGLSAEDMLRSLRLFASAVPAHAGELVAYEVPDDCIKDVLDDVARVRAWLEEFSDALEYQLNADNTAEDPGQGQPS